MASDLGWTLIRSEFDTHPTRQIWVRFHFFAHVLLSFLASVCAIYTVVHQRTLGAPRTTLLHIHGNTPNSHDSLLLLVLGRQRFNWRPRRQFIQVGLLCLWPVGSLLHLVCLSVRRVVACAY